MGTSMPEHHGKGILHFDLLTWHAALKLCFKAQAAVYLKIRVKVFEADFLDRISFKLRPER